MAAIVTCGPDPPGPPIAACPRHAPVGPFL